MANVAPPANDEERLRACLVVCGLTTANAQDGIIVQEGHTTLQELSRHRRPDVSLPAELLHRESEERDEKHIPLDAEYGDICFCK